MQPAEVEELQHQLAAVAAGPDDHRASEEANSSLQPSGDSDAPALDGDNDAAELEVEAIVDRRGDTYRVRWRGWGEDDDTWEPLANLKHSRQLVVQFEDERKRNALLKRKAKEQRQARRRAEKRQRETPAVTGSDRRQLLPAEGSAAAPAQLQVAEIVDAKGPPSRRLYRVRWAGYEAKHDTWEPDSNLGDEGLRLAGQYEDERAASICQSNTDKSELERKYSGLRVKTEGADGSINRATVLSERKFMDGSVEVLVHWLGWSKIWDEWIALDSERLVLPTNSPAISPVGKAEHPWPAADGPETAVRKPKRPQCAPSEIASAKKDDNQEPLLTCDQPASQQPTRHGWCQELVGWQFRLPGSVWGDYAQDGETREWARANSRELFLVRINEAYANPTPSEGKEIRFVVQHEAEPPFTVYGLHVWPCLDSRQKQRVAQLSGPLSGCAAPAHPDRVCDLSRLRKATPADLGLRVEVPIPNEHGVVIWWGGTIRAFAKGKFRVAYDDGTPQKLEPLDEQVFFPDPLEEKRCREPARATELVMVRDPEEKMQFVCRVVGARPGGRLRVRFIAWDRRHDITVAPKARTKAKEQQYLMEMTEAVQKQAQTFNEQIRKIDRARGEAARARIGCVVTAEGEEGSHTVKDVAIRKPTAKPNAAFAVFYHLQSEADESVTKWVAETALKDSRTTKGRAHRPRKGLAPEPRKGARVSCIGDALPDQVADAFVRHFQGENATGTLKSYVRAVRAVLSGAGLNLRHGTPLDDDNVVETVRTSELNGRSNGAALAGVRKFVLFCRASTGAQ